MKHLTMIVVLLGLFGLQACGQKENVPEKVKAAFDKQFTNTSHVKWDRENAHEWEVEFVMDKVEYSANFSNDGEWMETEKEIKYDELPDAVKQTVVQEFKGYDVEGVEVSTKPDGRVYELDLEKGDAEWEVVFSEDGKVLKKIKEDDEENDEDND